MQLEVKLENNDKIFANKFNKMEIMSKDIVLIVLEIMSKVNDDTYRCSHKPGISLHSFISTQFFPSLPSCFLNPSLHSHRYDPAEFTQSELLEQTWWKYTNFFRDPKFFRFDFFTKLFMKYDSNLLTCPL